MDQFNRIAATGAGKVRKSLGHEGGKLAVYGKDVKVRMFNPASCVSYKEHKKPQEQQQDQKQQMSVVSTIDNTGNKRQQSE